MNRSERRKLEKAQNKAAKSRGGVIPVAAEARAPLQNAIELFTKGQLGPSETACRTVLKIDPNQPVAINLLGLIAQRAGNADAAIQLFSTAIEKAPAFPDAHNNLGNVLLDIGDMEKAIACFNQAIKLNPRFAEALYNRSRVHAKLGEIDLAAKDCDKAIKLQPRYAEAHNSKGIVLSLQRRTDEAADSYRTALSINPNYADALTNLSLLLIDSGQMSEAEEMASKAVSLLPLSPSVHNNLGIILRNQGAYSKAADCFRRSLELDPNNAEAHDNLGNALSRLGNLDEAIESHKRSISLLPYSPSARNNISLIQLLRGEFSEGWENFESRLATVMQSGNDQTGANYGSEWRGEDISGKRILLWTEQGVGDQVLFSSMIPDLISAGALVSMQCDRRLEPLFERSFPEIRFVDQQTLERFNPDDVDFNAPIGNIGKWLRPDLSSFPEPKTFLSPDLQKRDALRKKYQGHGNDTVIGLAWKSSGPAYGELKSVPAGDLAPIISCPGVTFIDLQYGDEAEDRKALQDLTSQPIIHDEGVDQLDSLDDFAAQVAALDGVVSISNTTAHVAGALGVPMALMLGKVPLWYWQLERTDSLWYPHAHLFRQTKLDDWSDVIDSVAAAIPTLFTGK